MAHVARPAKTASSAASNRRSSTRVVSSGVSGELAEGKTTWLEHHGREFGLPEGHTAAWRDLHGKRCISLEATGGGGGQYYVEDVEEDDERVLVHVGEHVWETSYGEGSPSVELPAGYPFPT
jgi:hypothetical protein